MLAKRISTLSLPNNAAAEQTLERGKIIIPDKSQMQALYVKVTVGINNTSGGPVTLSDAQKQALFALIQLSINLGDDGHFQKPFDRNGQDRVQREFRRDFASELELYSDVTNGLSKPLPNAATTTVAFWMVLPLGKLWIQSGKTRELVAIGPSMARLIEAKVRLVGVTILANVVLNTNLTLDFFPDTNPARYDKVSPVPQWAEQTDTDVRAHGPEGLYLGIVEKTNVHASSPFTNTSLKIGTEQIYDAVGSPEVIVQPNDAALMPAIGLTSDRETLLYVPTDGERPFEKLPTGAFEFLQNGTQQLTTMLTGYQYIPIVKEADWARLCQSIATLRRRRIKLVSVASLEGIDIPDRLRPYVPAAVLTEDDKEFNAYAGLMCDPEGTPTIHIPPSVAAHAGALKSAKAAAKDALGTSDVAKRIAAQIPGAVQSGAGFGMGNSTTLNFVQGFLGR